MKNVQTDKILVSSATIKKKHYFLYFKMSVQVFFLFYIFGVYVCVCVCVQSGLIFFWCTYPENDFEVQGQ